MKSAFSQHPMFMCRLVDDFWMIKSTVESADWSIQCDIKKMGILRSILIQRNVQAKRDSEN